MLSSFRKLLLRKTDSEEMKGLIKNLSQESLAEYVVESLEKMAGNENSNPAHNEALKHFTEELEMQKDVSDTGEAHGAALIRDAMGHHASAYKKSLEQGKMKEAQHHAKQFVRYSDLSWKIHRKNKDVLNSDVVHLQPWQRTNPAFKDKSDPKDPTGQSKMWDCTNFKSHAHTGPKSDYSYLRGAPSPAYSDKVFQVPHKHENGVDHYHNGAYPMEHAKINNKYVTLHDDATPGSSHPMDHHPIMEAFKKDKGASYIEDLVKFHNSPAFQALNDKIQRAIDPESGKSPGEPVHNPSVYNSKLNIDNTASNSTPEQSSIPTTGTKLDHTAMIEQQLANLDPKDLDAILARIKNK